MFVAAHTVPRKNGSVSVKPAGAGLGPVPSTSSICSSHVLVVSSHASPRRGQGAPALHSPLSSAKQPNKNPATAKLVTPNTLRRRIMIVSFLFALSAAS
ncbi:hypothetical protein [Nannocystis pusilla]|uniref:hypothetical protein n=1 Tax=Nannocystis pusilla TaxID=889268 RepID=UPI003B81D7DC